MTKTVLKSYIRNRWHLISWNPYNSHHYILPPWLIFQVTLVFFKNPWRLSPTQYLYLFLLISPEFSTAFRVCLFPIIGLVKYVYITIWDVQILKFIKHAYELTNKLFTLIWLLILKILQLTPKSISKYYLC